MLGRVWLACLVAVEAFSLAPDPELASLTPPQFLLISSPMERKISYCVLSEFKSIDQKVHALIDSGLLSPQGIAVDQVNMALYVADGMQKTIFRYKLAVVQDPITSALSLETVDVPLVVVNNHEVTWLAVDGAGNLFFSDKSTSSILKMSVELIANLQRKMVKAGELKTESEIQLVVATTMALDTPRQVIISLYDTTSDNHTFSPEGVATNGMSVFWTNGGQGETKGALVRGPTSVTTAHVSIKLASNAESARGLCLTDHLAYFTSSSSVFAVPVQGGPPVKITQDLQSPRGCAWDGDGTVYISDGGSNSLFSFPSGVAAAKILDKVIEMHDPFGVAILSQFKVQT